MDSTSRVEEKGPGAPRTSGVGEAAGAPDGFGSRRVEVDGYLMASFPWYGLDEAFTGPRWLMEVGTGSDGTVEHGSTGHGEPPTLKVGADHDKQRFAVVVTLPNRPLRASPDGAGVLEATSVSSAAWLAGAGLLACTWPARMERALRDDWLEQQTAAAWELADDLDGPRWSMLTLPVDGVPTPFRHRRTEYGWVLAGSARDSVHIGAYGRGMSPYGVGFSVIKDITEYDA